MTESSGKTTTLAPSARARRVKSMILALLAAMAPTVGLIWASAMRIAGFYGGGAILPAYARSGCKSRWGRHSCLPSAAGAAIVVLAAMLVVAAVGLALSVPLQNWIHDAPIKLEMAEDKLNRL